MIAEHAAAGHDDDIFVYTGGEQVVPDDVTHVCWKTPNALMCLHY